MSRLLLFALLILCPGPAHAENDTLATMEAIQKQYELVKTFSAEFSQKSYVKMMGKAQQSSGTVVIKKPGKMKWVYNAPDPQVLISNDKTLWLYVPEEGQVSQMPVENVYSSNAPALFLSGKGKLMESFKTTGIKKIDRELVVSMVPKQEDHSLTRLALYADNKSFQITGATVYDKLGNQTEIRFTKIQINLDVPEATFQFVKPQGAELLDFTNKE
ncbi:MAG: outer membrane lipoprotein chaperone LolA [Candidatus Nitrohelix vancouverensis]|uniref:Outer-membrane lipoprotein carrier protein n=1 Tax=Candidatus Nitrohelix vancouverensis TaxID=2705534 RepID=A0A7T0G4G7_9BACT|nr:MAG: outer membrane lipoprotein chaperone LolA [Candidatus Nitrohelix vancouverensis]